MTRTALLRTLGATPIYLSALAFSVVVLALITGRQRNAADEGAAAHIFQCLIALQAPLILAYLGLADWRRKRDVIAQVVLQISAIGVALAPVAYFGL